MPFTIRSAPACGALLANIPSGGPYRRCLPDIRGPRPDWMPHQLWERFYEQVHPPTGQVVHLRDATIRGPGIITLPGDIIVGESLINCHHLDSVADLDRVGPGFYEAAAGFGPGTPLPPATYVLLKQMWDLNYGHWLIEALPRVALLHGVVDLAACRFLVSPVAEPMRSVVANSLALFGIGAAQIVVSGWEPRQVADLIYPLPLTVQPWVKAPLAIRILEQLAGRMTPNPAPADRLFIRRPATSRRPLLNQDALCALAERSGYRVITPAQMDFAQQVAAFAGASRVIGTLGAECANLACAQAGLRFLGLAPEAMQDDFFYDLVSHKQGRYACLHGKSADGEDGMNAAFSVDEGMFGEMIEELEE